MRQYFLTLLQSLDKLTGLKQYDKIMSTADPKAELNQLLDILCRVSTQFGHIPEYEQQRIVSEKIITDTEFIGLNAKVLFKWLSNISGAYIKHEAEKVPEGYKPLDGEDREKAIQKWLNSLKAMEASVKPELGGTRMKAAFEELPKQEGYKPPSMQEVLKMQLHDQWIRENFDKFGEKLTTYVDEQTWLKQKTI